MFIQYVIQQPLRAASLLVALLATTTTYAHGRVGEHVRPDQMTPPVRVSSGPTSTPQPVVARYRVTHTDRVTRTGPQVKRLEWLFVRDNDTVALIKGRVEDIWRRAADGCISFERVLHDDQRVIDYSCGELRSLGVTPSWAALSTFVDENEIAAMKRLGSTGTGDARRIRYAAATPNQARAASWSPALNLPTLLTRRIGRHAELRFELVEWHAQAPAGWPAPAMRAADYLRIDAADFGDMEYDPIVRKAEALDVKAGWRVAHRHE